MQLLPLIVIEQGICEANVPKLYCSDSSARVAGDTASQMGREPWEVLNLRGKGFEASATVSTKAYSALRY